MNAVKETIVVCDEVEILMEEDAVTEVTTHDSGTHRIIELSEEQVEELQEGQDEVLAVLSDMERSLPKTLRRAVDHSGLFTECYKDSDGYWLQLKSGFIGPYGTHCIHEITVKECLLQIRNVVSCSCKECRV